MSPFPNEHACRLRSPGDFQDDSFRRTSRESDGKKYDVIMAKLKGEDTMTEQAYRYPKDTWSSDEARTHCGEHEGSFEAASEDANTSGREVRSFGIELRAVEAADGGPVIEGTAVVYNKKSEVLWNFREIIEPGFFENCLDDDVRALWNHDDNLPLGRTKSGTLELADTSKGLNVRIHPPETQAGRDAVISIRRGDVDQMSFAFSVSMEGAEWKKEKNGELIRVLKRGGCERLYDVSPVTFPAYSETTVAVRSLVDRLLDQQSQLTASEPVPPAEEEGAQRPASRRRRLHNRLQLEKRK